MDGVAGGLTNRRVVPDLHRPHRRRKWFQGFQWFFLARFNFNFNFNFNCIFRIFLRIREKTTETTFRILARPNPLIMRGLEQHSRKSETT